MIRLTVLSLLGVSLLFPRAILAQKSATIAGNVYYGSDYNPARNVTVTLYDNERTVLESQNTSDDGLFRFGGLKRATYLIGVDIAGFEPVSIDVMDSGMKKLYHDKDAHAALPDFQQALALAPAYYEAAYQLGMAQLSLGDRAQAEKSFRGSFEQSKHTYGESAVALGAALLDLGNTSEAEQFIRRGLVLNPNLWLGHYELGRALLQQKRLSDALTSAEQARLLAPSVPIVYRLLSNIHLQQENYPALLADLDTYLTLDPSSPAGLRAKQLRDQLQSQAAQHAPPPPKP
jgi:tetratricopeptide (TPR) repeat protein